MSRRVILILLIIFILNSCVLIKIDKDSKPLVDFGTPIIGHFRNGDTVKGVMYTLFFCVSLVFVVLFAPTQYDIKDNLSRSIIPVSREISDPLFYTFIGSTALSFGASSIDTAVTYHLANKKIIELNNINWDKESKITKYQAITDFREKKVSAADNEEVNYYRKRLIDGSITEDEIIFIKSIPELETALEKELGYYLIRKELKEEQVKDK